MKGKVMGRKREMKGGGRQERGERRREEEFAACAPAETEVWLRHCCCFHHSEPKLKLNYNISRYRPTLRATRADKSCISASVRYIRQRDADFESDRCVFLGSGVVSRRACVSFDEASLEIDYD